MFRLRFYGAAQNIIVSGFRIPPLNPQIIIKTGRGGPPKSLAGPRDAKTKKKTETMADALNLCSHTLCNPNATKPRQSEQNKDLSNAEFMVALSWLLLFFAFAIALLFLDLVLMVSGLKVRCVSCTVAVNFASLQTFGEPLTYP